MERIKDDVRELMSGDNSGHGFDHVERVYKIAVKWLKKKKPMWKLSLWRFCFYFVLKVK